MKYPTVPGRLIVIPEGESVGAVITKGAPGVFAWGRVLYGKGLEVEKLYFRSPNSADPYVHGLPVVREEGGALALRLEEMGVTYWVWDGNRERPTLSPSVASPASSGHPWHGHLQAGVWVACE